MTWFCPTFQRPDGLRKLADSWVKYAENTPLFVRIWEQDAKRDEYFREKWPESWTLYVSDTRYFTQAMNEFLARNPDEETYGFIADDVVLTGRGALDHLDALASPFFIAYPNDTIQRSRLPTHYSIGGELVRTLGWFAPPFLRHLYTDNVWKLLGQNTGLLRYAPQIVFYHNHFIRHRAEYDDTYREVYNPEGLMIGEIARHDQRAFTEYANGEALKMDVQLLQATMLWVENQIRKEAGLDEEIVHSNQSEPVVQTGDVSGGVGRRERAGNMQELVGETRRVQGVGTAQASDGTPAGDSADSQGGDRLQARGCPFPLTAREYKYPNAQVVVSVPSGGEWKAQTATSVALMVTDFMQNGLAGLATRQLHLNSTESSMLVSNRHNAVKTTLQVNASHLLFVDSDMKFPPWALRRLMSHDLPFVAANCTKRAFPVTGTAHDFDGKIIESVNRTGLEVVRQVGLAFALIRRDVLEALQPPLFMMEWIEDMKGYCGEDIFFAQKIQAAGFDVVIDHDLSRQIGHIGSFTYGHGQVGVETPPHWMKGN